MERKWNGKIAYSCYYFILCLYQHRLVYVLRYIVKLLLTVCGYIFYEYNEETNYQFVLVIEFAHHILEMAIMFGY